MTTRYEAVVQEIEHRMAHPSGGKKVHPAEVIYRNTIRQQEKDRDARTAKLGKTITIQWMDGEPERWNPADAIVTIGEQDRIYTVEPMETVDGKDRVKRELVNLGYRGVVEKWALWKWHTDRGAEIDDNDAYILDCELPKFVWKAAAKIKAA